VRYFVNQHECDSILDHIGDDAARSDQAPISLHTHAGVDENRYPPRAPAFIEDFARATIDAGARRIPRLRWPRLSEQKFRVDKWSLCRVS
jgi:hypothetical protein